MNGYISVDEFHWRLKLKAQKDAAHNPKRIWDWLFADAILKDCPKVMVDRRAGTGDRPANATPKTYKRICSICKSAANDIKNDYNFCPYCGAQWIHLEEQE